KCQEKHLQNHRKMFLQINSRLPVKLHGMFQFFQPLLSVFHQSHPCQQGTARAEHPFHQHRMEHQQQQNSHTDHIQSQPQPVNGKDIFQILFHKSPVKQRKIDTDQHQYQLIGNGHDHQHQVRDRQLKHFLYHVDHLHTLSDAGGMSNAAEEKSHGRDQKAFSVGQRNLHSPQQVRNDKRFSPDNKQDVKNCRQQPADICSSDTF